MAISECKLAIVELAPQIFEKAQGFVHFACTEARVNVGRGQVQEGPLFLHYVLKQVAVLRWAGSVHAKQWCNMFTHQFDRGKSPGLLRECGCRDISRRQWGGEGPDREAVGVGP
jgi:hypothetical protein